MCQFKANNVQVVNKDYNKHLSSHIQVVTLNKDFTNFLDLTNLRAHGYKLREVEATHSNLGHLHQLPERVKMNSKQPFFRSSHKAGKTNLEWQRTAATESNYRLIIVQLSLPFLKVLSHAVNFQQWQLHAVASHLSR